MSWNKTTDIKFSEMAKYNELPHDHDNAGEFSFSQPIAGGGIAMGSSEDRSLGGKLKTGTGASSDVKVSDFLYTSENASVDDDSKHAFFCNFVTNNKESGSFITGSSPDDITASGGPVVLSAEEYVINQFRARPQVAGRQYYNTSASTVLNREIYESDSSYSTLLDYCNRGGTGTHYYRSRRWENKTGTWYDGDFTLSDADGSGYSAALHDGYIFHYGHLSRYEVNRVNYQFGHSTSNTTTDLNSGSGGMNTVVLNTDGTYSTESNFGYPVFKGYFPILRVKIASGDGNFLGDNQALLADDVGWTQNLTNAWSMSRLPSSPGYYTSQSSVYTGNYTTDLVTDNWEDYWNPVQQTPASVNRKGAQPTELVDPQETDTYYGIHSCSVFIELSIRYVLVENVGTVTSGTLVYK